MYKITEAKITVENKEYNSYGIYYNDSLYINDISVDKKAVEKLVRLCNEGELDPVHLYYVVEDFLAEGEI